MYMDTDLFANITPMVVLDAVSVFETRKSEILCHELGRLRDATRALNSLVRHSLLFVGWVGHWSLTGKLSLVCTGPAANG